MIFSTINGRLCKDAEVKHFGEYEMLTFSLPHEEKNADGSSETYWINFAIGNLRLQEYLKKGKSIIVNGEWHFRKDKNDPSKVYYEVRYGNVRFAISDSKALTESTQATPATNATPAPKTVVEPAPDFSVNPNDALPF